MSCKPILFSTPMVKAIMEGRKTQTRRVIKFPPDHDGKEVYSNGMFGCKYSVADGTIHRLYPPYGTVGEVLWVRETWNYDYSVINEHHHYYFKASKETLPKYIQNGIADKDFSFEDVAWRPSIYMPKDACRIFLKITNVRVERLHDISEADAKAEGVDHVIDKITGYCGYNYLHGGYNLMTTPRAGFASLWQKINGEESWNENPWLWVIEFTRIEKPPGWPL